MPEEKVWDKTTNEMKELPTELKKFYEEVDLLCKKYNYSISHEDGHGAFEIQKYDQKNIDWLKNANLDGI